MYEDFFKDGLRTCLQDRVRTNTIGHVLSGQMQRPRRPHTFTIDSDNVQSIDVYEKATRLLTILPINIVKLKLFYIQ